MLSILNSSAEKMAHMNSASYEKLRSLSRGKFSPQQFLQLKELAANTVGVNNSIFDVELNSLLSLYKSLDQLFSIVFICLKGILLSNYLSSPVYLY